MRKRALIRIDFETDDDVNAQWAHVQWITRGMTQRPLAERERRFRILGFKLSKRGADWRLFYGGV